MMSYVTRTVVLVGFVVPCSLPSRMTLGCGHLRLDISELPTRTRQAYLDLDHRDELGDKSRGASRSDLF